MTSLSLKGFANSHEPQLMLPAKSAQDENCETTACLLHGPEFQTALCIRSKTLMRTADGRSVAVACHRRGASLQRLTTAICLVACLELFPSIDFSLPAGKQLPLSVLRERTGQSISVSVDRDEHELFKDNLTAREKQLTSFLAQAGRHGDWSQVSRLWGRYSGTALAVHRAAMQAAFHCARYEDAARIYEKLRNLPGFTPDSISSGRGMKVFGKLGRREDVSAIWSEAVDTNLTNRLVASARINAAASMGDIEGAAQGLDFMFTNDMEPDTPDFNSAINACATADPPSPSAAMYVYEQMLKKDLQPSIITFTSLVRAHDRARCSKIEALLSEMKTTGIEPNKVFAEAFISAVFGGERLKTMSAKTMCARIAAMSPRRRQLLQQTLQDFRMRTETTRLSQQVWKLLTV